MENFPRRASFIATANQLDILTDPTGNRRFLAVELTAPIDVSVKPNYEQLYAQAMHALYRHVPHYFNADETQAIMESNQKFCTRTAVEQFFLDYFDVATDENDGEWITPTKILALLKKKVTKDATFYLVKRRK